MGATEDAGVRHFRIEQLEHPVEYASITDMFTTFEAAYTRGIFFVDPSGYLEEDDGGYATLAAALNPAISWWSE
jgi:hypothetical protein